MDDEERYGAGLRALMRTVDVPPPRADVSSAVRVGRRRHQTRTVGIAAASVLVVAVAVVGYATTGPRRAGPNPVGVAPSGTAEAQRCAVSALETGPGGDYRVVATDPTGHYFVGYRMVAERTTVVLWTDGKLRDLGFEGAPVAVNAKGVIAGYFGSDDTARAFVYRDGHATQLPVPTGYSGTMPEGINARGDVVGYAMKGALDVNLALFWPADQPTKATTLSTPSGIGRKGTSSLRASGINDDRTIVGWVRDVPVSWSPDGAVHKLPLPDGDDLGSPVHVRGRYVYGDAAKSGQRSRMVRWDLTAGGPPTIVAEASYQVVDGTPTGWTLLGDMQKADELIDPSGASTPLRAPDKATVSAPVSISDDARTIVGMAGTDSGAGPVVWHC